MKLSPIRPEGTEQSRISINKDSGSPQRLELHAKNSIESSGESTSCLGSIINAITGLFRAIFNLITCNWSKTKEAPQEEEKSFEPSQEEESASDPEDKPTKISTTPQPQQIPSNPNTSTHQPPQPPPTTNTNPSIPSSKVEKIIPPNEEQKVVSKKEAATQFLDDFYADPSKTVKTLNQYAFNNWQKDCPAMTPINDFWKNTFVHFLCANEDTTSPEKSDDLIYDDSMTIPYKGQYFSIEPWMIEYYVNKYNPDLTQQVAKKQCPLHLARSKNTAQLLLDKCPGLREQRDEYGYTPLILASEKDLPDVVDCLIANNANCLATSTLFGHTALHCARSLTVAKQLMAKERTLLNAKNLVSQTPLHVAANRGNEELVRYYIEEGANLRIPDRSGTISVALCKSPKLAKLFLDKDKELAKHRNGEGNIPLCFALNAAMAGFFLEYGAQIESINNGGETPLSVLLENSYTEAAEALVLRGANLEIKVGKEPLLHFLINKWSAEAYRALFKTVFGKRSQDVNILDTQGRTLLQRAIELNANSNRKDLFAIIHSLIDQGANLDIKIDNEPLLHFLIGKSMNEEWSALFKRVLALRPQDIEVHDTQERTLLQHVVESNSGNYDAYFDLIKLLIDKKANLNVKIGKEPLLHFLIGKCINDKWRDVFRNVLALRPQDIEVLDTQERTLLQHIVESNSGNHDAYFVLIYLLIDRGANLDVNIGKEPLLHFLSIKSINDTWRALFKKVLALRPKDIEVQDTQGRTLLQRVVESNSGNHGAFFELINLLIDQGAKLDVKIGKEPLLHFLSTKCIDDTWRALFKKVLALRPKDIEVTDTQGRTLLQRVVESNSGNHSQYFDAIHYLIDQGANLSVNIGKEPLLHFLINRCINNAWRAVFRKVLPKKVEDVDVADTQGRTPLQRALEANTSNQSEYFEVINLLIDMGAKVDIKPSGKPILHFVISKSQDKQWGVLFKKLLEKKDIDIEALDEGRTPLQAILGRYLNYTSNEYATIVNLLIDRGANLKVTVGAEPVLHAIIKTHLTPEMCQVFKRLVNSGTLDIEVDDTKKRKPLQHALEQCDASSYADGHFDVALFLIGKKAKTDFKIRAKPVREWVADRSDNKNWKAIAEALNVSS